MKLRVAASVAICLALLSSAAADPAPPPLVELPAAGPFVKLNSPRVACLGTPLAPEGCVQLDVGYYMSQATYENLDGALVRLQDAETRLQAENARLREVTLRWQPGWKSLATMFVVGLAAGAYVGLQL